MLGICFYGNVFARSVGCFRENFSRVSENAEKRKANRSGDLTNQQNNTTIMNDDRKTPETRLTRDSLMPVLKKMLEGENLLKLTLRMVRERLAAKLGGNVDSAKKLITAIVKEIIDADGDQAETDGEAAEKAEAEEMTAAAANESEGEEQAGGRARKRAGKRAGKRAEEGAGKEGAGKGRTVTKRGSLDYQVLESGHGWRFVVWQAKINALHAALLASPSDEESERIIDEFQREARRADSEARAAGIKRKREQEAAAAAREVAPKRWRGGGGADPS